MPTSTLKVHHFATTCLLNNINTIAASCTMPLPPPTSLGLPAKPGSAPAPTSAASTSSTSAAAGPSRSTKCAMCANEAKYTCPRCAARTCSAACSKAHKEKRGCSGVRDPAAYVPLAKYTQGTWDGDYAWLEATRRQVAEFGEGIGADEAAAAGRGEERGRGRGRGRGGRGGAVGGRPRKSKLDGLRWAVGQVGAEVDVLPDGMQRRRQNQSSWNPK